MGSARTRQTTTGRPRGKRNAPRRLNRAEQQALAARSSQARASRPTEPAVGPTTSSLGGVLPTGVTAPRVIADAPARREGANRRRPTSQPMTISRDQEFRFIRADLRRLLVTAAALLVLMLALLAFVG
ncbi:MAG: hypothetical protein AVDCRST_MAG49-3214 [uncultured Thermomicrobiales bacterium]|uniref:Uncharacterized protein n=1 Tax=uncultured Thermomicrobiales bacterium TaxID=1645740 RepID=A0A6J4V4H1_9BACT|nr:MAG: hypothetical protein AVDCRST_MAG49-3214 [uncultured Thermomicrobiales bacterium]